MTQFFWFETPCERHANFADCVHPKFIRLLSVTGEMSQPELRLILHDVIKG